MKSESVPRRPFKSLLLVIFLSCGFVAVVEMGLQLVHLTALVASDPDLFIHPDRLKKVSVGRKIDDPVLGHRPNPKFHEHDAKGFRNSSVPEPGQVDIIAIGDSQTYGTNAHRPEAWPQQLAENTGFSTYNMAFGGYSALHHSLLLDEALALNPRLVIAAVYFGNDFLEAFLLGYRENHVARYSSKNPGVKKRVMALEKSDPVSATVKKFADNPDYSMVYSQTGIWDWLEKNSQIVQKLTPLRNWAAGKLLNPRQCLEPIPPDRSPPAAAAPTVLTPRYRWVTVNAKDPRVQEGLRLTRSALGEMQRRTRDAGVEFLVVMIPTKERVYKEVVKATNAPAIFDQLIEDEEALENALIQYFERENIPHLPLLNSLKLTLWSDLAPYPNNNDGHPNGTGYKAMAQCIAAYIEREKTLAAR